MFGHSSSPSSKLFFLLPNTFSDCPDGYTCLGDVGENPRYGYLNFDHFGWSLLTCFQLITLDFWEDIYNKVKQLTVTVCLYCYGRLRRTILHTILNKGELISKLI